MSDHIHRQKHGERDHDSDNQLDPPSEFSLSPDRSGSQQRQLGRLKKTERLSPSSQNSSYQAGSPISPSPRVHPTSILSPSPSSKMLIASPVRISSPNQKKTRSNVIRPKSSAGNPLGSQMNASPHVHGVFPPMSPNRIRRPYDHHLQSSPAGTKTSEFLFALGPPTPGGTVHPTSHAGHSDYNHSDRLSDEFTKSPGNVHDDGDEKHDQTWETKFAQSTAYPDSSQGGTPLHLSSIPDHGSVLALRFSPDDNEDGKQPESNYQAGSLSTSHSTYSGIATRHGVVFSPLTDITHPHIANNAQQPYQRHDNIPQTVDANAPLPLPPAGLLQHPSHHQPHANDNNRIPSPPPSAPSIHDLPFNPKDYLPNQTYTVSTHKIYQFLYQYRYLLRPQSHVYIPRYVMSVSSIFTGNRNYYATIRHLHHALLASQDEYHKAHSNGGLLPGKARQNSDEAPALKSDAKHNDHHSSPPNSHLSPTQSSPSLASTMELRAVLDPLITRLLQRDSLPQYPSPKLAAYFDASRNILSNLFHQVVHVDVNFNHPSLLTSIKTLYSHRMRHWVVSSDALCTQLHEDIVVSMTPSSAASSTTPKTVAQGATAPIGTSPGHDPHNNHGSITPQSCLFTMDPLYNKDIRPTRFREDQSDQDSASDINNAHPMASIPALISMSLYGSQFSYEALYKQLSDQGESRPSSSSRAGGATSHAHKPNDGSHTIESMGDANSSHSSENLSPPRSSSSQSPRPLLKDPILGLPLTPNHLQALYTTNTPPGSSSTSHTTPRGKASPSGIPSPRRQSDVLLFDCHDADEKNFLVNMIDFAFPSGTFVDLICPSHTVIIDSSDHHDDSSPSKGLPQQPFNHINPNRGGAGVASAPASSTMNPKTHTSHASLSPQYFHSHGSPNQQSDYASKRQSPHHQHPGTSTENRKYSQPRIHQFILTDVDGTLSYCTAITAYAHIPLHYLCEKYGHENHPHSHPQQQEHRTTCPSGSGDSSSISGSTSASNHSTFDPSLHGIPQLSPSSSLTTTGSQTHAPVIPNSVSIGHESGSQSAAEQKQQRDGTTQQHSDLHHPPCLSSYMALMRSPPVIRPNIRRYSTRHQGGSTHPLQPGPTSNRAPQQAVYAHGSTPSEQTTTSHELHQQKVIKERKHATQTSTPGGPEVPLLSSDHTTARNHPYQRGEISPASVLSNGSSVSNHSPHHSYWTYKCPGCILIIPQVVVLICKQPVDDLFKSLLLTSYTSFMRPNSAWMPWQQQQQHRRPHHQGPHDHLAGSFTPLSTYSSRSSASSSLSGHTLTTASSLSSGNQSSRYHGTPFSQSPAYDLTSPPSKYTIGKAKARTRLFTKPITTTSSQTSSESGRTSLPNESSSLGPSTDTPLSELSLVTSHPSTSTQSPTSMSVGALLPSKKPADDVMSPLTPLSLMSPTIMGQDYVHPQDWQWSGYDVVSPYILCNHPYAPHHPCILESFSDRHMSHGTQIHGVVSPSRTTPCASLDTHLNTSNRQARATPYIYTPPFPICFSAFSPYYAPLLIPILASLCINAVLWSSVPLTLGETQLAYVFDNTPPTIQPSQESTSGERNPPNDRDSGSTQQPSLDKTIILAQPSKLALVLAKLASMPTQILPLLNECIPVLDPTASFSSQSASSSQAKTPVADEEGHRGSSEHDNELRHPLVPCSQPTALPWEVVSPPRVFQLGHSSKGGPRSSPLTSKLSSLTPRSIRSVLNRHTFPSFLVHTSMCLEQHHPCLVGLSSTLFTSLYYSTAQRHANHTLQSYMSHSKSNELGFNLSPLDRAQYPQLFTSPQNNRRLVQSKRKENRTHSIHSPGSMPGFATVLTQHKITSHNRNKTEYNLNDSPNGDAVIKGKSPSRNGRTRSDKRKKRQPHTTRNSNSYVSDSIRSTERVTLSSSSTSSTPPSNLSNGESSKEHTASKSILTSTSPLGEDSVSSPASSEPIGYTHGSNTGSLSLSPGSQFPPDERNGTPPSLLLSPDSSMGSSSGGTDSMQFSPSALTTKGKTCMPNPVINLLTSQLLSHLSALPPSLSPSIYTSSSFTSLTSVPSSAISFLFDVLLQQQSVAVVGSDPMRVYNVTTSLMLLLQPLPFVLPFIPLLPTALIDVLQSPQPYLIGTAYPSSGSPLLTTTGPEPNAGDSLRLRIPVTTYVYNLDTAQISLPVAENGDTFGDVHEITTPLSLVQRPTPAHDAMSGSTRSTTTPQSGVGIGVGSEHDDQYSQAGGEVQTLSLATFLDEDEDDDDLTPLTPIIEQPLRVAPQESPSYLSAGKYAQHQQQQQGHNTPLTQSSLSSLPNTIASSMTQLTQRVAGRLLSPRPFYHHNYSPLDSYIDHELINAITNDYNGLSFDQYHDPYLKPSLTIDITNQYQIHDHAPLQSSPTTASAPPLLQNISPAQGRDAFGSQIHRSTSQPLKHEQLKSAQPSIDLTEDMMLLFIMWKNYHLDHGNHYSIVYDVSAPSGSGGDHLLYQQSYKSTGRTTTSVTGGLLPLISLDEYLKLQKFDLYHRPQYYLLHHRSKDKSNKSGSGDSMTLEALRQTVYTSRMYMSPSSQAVIPFTKCASVLPSKTDGKSDKGSQPDRHTAPTSSPALKETSIDLIYADTVGNIGLVQKYGHLHDPHDALSIYALSHIGYKDIFTHVIAVKSVVDLFQTFPSFLLFVRRLYSTRMKLYRHREQYLKLRDRFIMRRIEHNIWLAHRVHAGAGYGRAHRPGYEPNTYLTGRFPHHNGALRQIPQDPGILGHHTKSIGTAGSMTTGPISAELNIPASGSVQSTFNWKLDQSDTTSREPAHLSPSTTTAETMLHANIETVHKSTPSAANTEPEGLISNYMMQNRAEIQDGSNKSSSDAVTTIFSQWFGSQKSTKLSEDQSTSTASMGIRSATPSIGHTLSQADKTRAAFGSTEDGRHCYHTNHLSSHHNDSLHQRQHQHQHHGLPTPLSSMVNTIDSPVIPPIKPPPDPFEFLGDSSIEMHHLTASVSINLNVVGGALLAYYRHLSCDTTARVECVFNRHQSLIHQQQQHHHSTSNDQKGTRLSPPQHKLQPSTGSMTQRSQSRGILATLNNNLPSHPKSKGNKHPHHPPKHPMSGMPFHSPQYSSISSPSPPPSSLLLSPLSFRSSLSTSPPARLLSPPYSRRSPKANIATILSQLTPTKRWFGLSANFSLVPLISSLSPLSSSSWIGGNHALMQKSAPTSLHQSTLSSSLSSFTVPKSFQFPCSKDTNAEEIVDLLRLFTQVNRCHACGSLDFIDCSHCGLNDQCKACSLRLTYSIGILPSSVSANPESSRDAGGGSSTAAQCSSRGPSGTVVIEAHGHHGMSSPSDCYSSEPPSGHEIDPYQALSPSSALEGSFVDRYPVQGRHSEGSRPIQRSPVVQEREQQAQEQQHLQSQQTTNHSHRQQPLSSSDADFNLPGYSRDLHCFFDEHDNRCIRHCHCQKDQGRDRPAHLSSQHQFGTGVSHLTPREQPSLFPQSKLDHALSSSPATHSPQYAALPSSPAYGMLTPSSRALPPPTPTPRGYHHSSRRTASAIDSSTTPRGLRKGTGVSTPSHADQTSLGSPPTSPPDSLAMQLYRPILFSITNNSLYGMLPILLLLLRNGTIVPNPNRHLRCINQSGSKYDMSCKDGYQYRRDVTMASPSQQRTIYESYGSNTDKRGSTDNDKSQTKPSSHRGSMGLQAIASPSTPHDTTSLHLQVGVDIQQSHSHRDISTPHEITPHDAHQPLSDASLPLGKLRSQCGTSPPPPHHPASSQIPQSPAPFRTELDELISSLILGTTVGMAVDTTTPCYCCHCMPLLFHLTQAELLVLSSWLLQIDLMQHVTTSLARGYLSSLQNSLLLQEAGTLPRRIEEQKDRHGGTVPPSTSHHHFGGQDLISQIYKTRQLQREQQQRQYDELHFPTSLCDHPIQEEEEDDINGDDEDDVGDHIHPKSEGEGTQNQHENQSPHSLKTDRIGEQKYDEDETVTSPSASKSRTYSRTSSQRHSTTNATSPSRQISSSRKSGVSSVKTVSTSRSKTHSINDESASASTLRKMVPSLFALGNTTTTPTAGGTKGKASSTQTALIQSQEIFPFNFSSYYIENVRRQSSIYCYDSLTSTASEYGRNDIALFVSTQHYVRFAEMRLALRSSTLIHLPRHVDIIQRPPSYPYNLSNGSFYTNQHHQYQHQQQQQYYKGTSSQMSAPKSHVTSHPQLYSPVRSTTGSAYGQQTHSARLFEHDAVAPGVSPHHSQHLHNSTPKRHTHANNMSTAHNVAVVHRTPPIRDITPITSGTHPDYGQRNPSPIIEGMIQTGTAAATATGVPTGMRPVSTPPLHHSHRHTPDNLSTASQIIPQLSHQSVQQYSTDNQTPSEEHHQPWEEVAARPDAPTTPTAPEISSLSGSSNPQGGDSGAPHNQWSGGDDRKDHQLDDIECPQYNRRNMIRRGSHHSMTSHRDFLLNNDPYALVEGDLACRNQSSSYHNPNPQQHVHDQPHGQSDKIPFDLFDITICTHLTNTLLLLYWLSRRQMSLVAACQGKTIFGMRMNWETHLVRLAGYTLSWCPPSSTLHQPVSGSANVIPPGAHADTHLIGSPQLDVRDSDRGRVHNISHQHANASIHGGEGIIPNRYQDQRLSDYITMSNAAESDTMPRHTLYDISEETYAGLRYDQSLSTLPSASTYHSDLDSFRHSLPIDLLNRPSQQHMHNNINLRHAHAAAMGNASNPSNDILPLAIHRPSLEESRNRDSVVGGTHGDHHPHAHSDHHLQQQQQQQQQQPPQQFTFDHIDSGHKQSVESEPINYSTASHQTLKRNTTPQHPSHRTQEQSIELVPFNTVVGLVEFDHLFAKKSPIERRTASTIDEYSLDTFSDRYSKSHQKSGVFYPYMCSQYITHDLQNYIDGLMEHYGHYVYKYGAKTSYAMLVVSISIDKPPQEGSFAPPLAAGHTKGGESASPFSEPKASSSPSSTVSPRREIKQKDQELRGIQQQGTTSETTIPHEKLHIHRQSDNDDNHTNSSDMSNTDSESSTTSRLSDFLLSRLFWTKTITTTDPLLKKRFKHCLLFFNDAISPVVLMKSIIARTTDLIDHTHELLKTYTSTILQLNMTNVIGYGNRFVAFDYLQPTIEYYAQHIDKALRDQCGQQYPEGKYNHFNHTQQKQQIQPSQNLQQKTLRFYLNRYSVFNPQLCSSISKVIPLQQYQPHHQHSLDVHESKHLIRQSGGTLDAHTTQTDQGNSIYNKAHRSAVVSPSASTSSTTSSAVSGISSFAKSPLLPQSMHLRVVHTPQQPSSFSQSQPPLHRISTHDSIHLSTTSRASSVAGDHLTPGSFSHAAITPRPSLNSHASLSPLSLDRSLSAFSTSSTASSLLIVATSDQGGVSLSNSQAGDGLYSEALLETDHEHGYASDSIKSKTRDLDVIQPSQIPLSHLPTGSSVKVQVQGASKTTHTDTTRVSNSQYQQQQQGYQSSSSLSVYHTTTGGGRQHPSRHMHSKRSANYSQTNFTGINQPVTQQYNSLRPGPVSFLPSMQRHPSQQGTIGHQSDQRRASTQQHQHRTNQSQQQQPHTDDDASQKQ